MNYELAKKLKDAGFSQELFGQYDATTFYGGTLVPILEELIEACKHKYFILQRENGKWVALIMHSGCTGKGKTMKEAVANLWLKLKKKEKENEKI